ncbi:TetR/AcrR family transcriptional regulator [Psychrobacillus sp. OK032]|uniref:TetR/AcrR family transcriptional regulator n=1 Tax=Psychrobacillus sp. OK032 TaxID=1884358 RepID=UPI0015A73286|nr:TetR/AcrR family transcriptional regulator [Psychrobacillus sp. OK032]
MNQEKPHDENRSIRRTKRIFKLHFISLIREKGYKNVTVTDIVDRADYNRSTFYLYFKDKEDLTEELVNDVLDELHYSFHIPFEDVEVVKYNRILPSSNTFFQHLYERKQFYSLLTIQDTIPGLEQKFLGKMKEIFDAITYIDTEKEEVQIEHFNTYKMYGSYGVILEWIKGGYEKSPDEIADNLLEIFKTNTSSFRFN